MEPRPTEGIWNESGCGMSWWEGANTDYPARGPRLPTPSTIVERKAFSIGPGGKGATQAVPEARLGARMTLLARLGRDEHGDALLAQLTSEGAFAEGCTLAEASPFASAAAALATTGLGAQDALPRRVAAMELLARPTPAEC